MAAFSDGLAIPRASSPRSPHRRNRHERHGHSDFPAGRRVRLPRNRSSKGVCIMTSVSTTGPGPAKLLWWTPGDWNAFFGFGTNILVNVLVLRSEEHTSELQSLMRTSYAVFCLKQKN